MQTVYLCYRYQEVPFCSNSLEQVREYLDDVMHMQWIETFTVPSNQKEVAYSIVTDSNGSERLTAIYTNDFLSNQQLWLEQRIEELKEAIVNVAIENTAEFCDIECADDIPVNYYTSVDELPNYNCWQMPRTEIAVIQTKNTTSVQVPCSYLDTYNFTTGVIILNK